ncbi:hypothetical protein QBC34DRAFT_458810 [Podospora aff. communis PSN243]|uniref:Uncharacterized protein n=1 Tax=Podospora aff. communis PSN243 TaxID=3040156 RepID=A0AAV9GSI0_9PEZI|nr:hypothetical protein QBC34DRAFT_458810 [Podospora aff. communis PSN243]
MHLTPALLLLIAPGLSHAVAVAPQAAPPKVEARDLDVETPPAGESVTLNLDHLVLSDDGFIPPEGPDGLFQLGIDEKTGTFTVTTLELFDGSPPAKRDIGSDATPAGLATRSLPITSWGCEGQASALASHMGGAVMAFGNWCDAGGRIPAHNAIFARSGDAIAYGCSAGGLNPCGSSELASFVSFMTAHCYRHALGWAWMPSWAKSYGRSLRGQAICTTICNCVPWKAKRALQGDAAEVSPAKLG